MRETVDDLAHEIAEQASKELIDSASLSVRDSGLVFWCDISAPDPMEAEALKQAVKYLDLAGILKRSPENPEWVGWDEDN